MELTGKSKVDFENWWSEYQQSFFMDLNDAAMSIYDLPESMQFGMYVDFFDSKGIDIEIGIDYTLEPKYCFKINAGNWSDLEYTRGKARKAAIEKACEIYNKNCLQKEKKEEEFKKLKDV